MSVLYEEVPADAIGARAHLLEAHWQEVARNKKLMVLAPDMERYRALQATGKLMVLAAFTDGLCAGYSVNIIDTHLHYAGLTYCQNDLLYVHPQYRASPLGLGLMRETRKRAKERGAGLMLWHAKLDTPLHQILTRSRKASVQDVIFSEEL